MEEEMEQEEEGEGKRELRELQEEQYRLRSLKDHPGFKYLQEVLQAQVETRTKAIILAPLASLDEVPNQEYAKGEAAGILFAKEFVDTRLNALAEEIQDILEKKESGDEQTVEY
jgi:hypothetical protein